VILAIKNKAAHVPYRNSTLTRLLEPAMKGDAKVREEKYAISCCIPLIPSFFITKLMVISVVSYRGSTIA
jgi:hypothetical protein